MVNRCGLASFTKNKRLCGYASFFMYNRRTFTFPLVSFSWFFFAPRSSLSQGPIIVTSLWNFREQKIQSSVTLSSNEKVEAVISVVLHGAGAHLFRSSTMSVNEQAPTRWFILMPIHVENKEEWRRESPCDRSTWYINARVSVRVNSQRGKNVKCSSFTRCCVVINNNDRVNYYVRTGGVRMFSGCDSHENVETY